MNLDDCFQLGYVIKPHGFKGELSLQIDADNPQLYKKLKVLYLEINRAPVPYFIGSLQIREDKAIVKLEELNDEKTARTLMGCSVLLPLTQLPTLSESQFYYHEIIGFGIEDQELGTLGEVSAVYELGQQDVIAMQYRGVEALIPVHEDIITKVNRTERKLYTHIPQGLLEIYLQPDAKPDDDDAN